VTPTRPYIALVDDEAPVCVALSRLLRLGGYEPGAFSSGEAFLESLQIRRPAGLILDVQLPGMSGFEVRTRLREAGENIPIVFITASENVGLSSVRAETGVRLLRKPFSNATLLDAIGAALDRRPQADYGN